MGAHVGRGVGAGQVSVRDQARGTRHQTPAHLARLLLARVGRWFPARPFIFVGETGYGTSETARCCHRHGRQLTLVSKVYGDAA
jgi:hypothetical protein